MSVITYLNQLCGIQAPNGQNRYGKSQWGPEYMEKCRLQGSKARVIDDKGNQVQADAEIWVGPNAQLDAEYRVNFESKVYRVMKLDVKRNFNGTINHKKGLLLESKE